MKKVLLVDDHSLILGGIENTIGKFYFVDYAASTLEALEKLEIETYYAIILDVSLGETKGFDIVKSIPDKIFMFFLSMHKSSVYIQMAKDFGASGYFLKDESPELLLKALNRPFERDFWMSLAVETELKNTKTYEGSNYEMLSPREQQIFAMLAEDLSYKEIASRLNLSAKTVNNHRAHLMKKLRIDTQTGLVREAVHLGIISVE